MAYARPDNLKLDKAEKTLLLQEYVAYYAKAVKEQGLEALNAKIPGNVFDQILDMIGELLQKSANQLLKENENVQDFLQSNPLPAGLAELLPDKFRVFALLLNALKQWVAAESLATDRFLLGGTARRICREAVNHCIVTGEKLNDGAELHHPVRDGRPPILLSKKGHERVEQALTDTVSGNLTENQNELWQKLQLLRDKRNQSWAQLREGCVTLLNPEKPCRYRAKSFANVAIRETGSTPEEIIQLLDKISK